MYFYEDEVYAIDKKNNVKFGLVLEIDEFELRENLVRVVWHASGLDEIVNTDKIGLADRTLMPGDVVRRMNISENNCKDLQRGYCREIHVKADLKIIGNSKYVIKDVSSERLTPLIKMPRDNAVCLDSWVGSTKNIDEKLTLKSTCGSILELRPDIEFCPLKDKNMRNRCGFFGGTLFYVGQTLVGNVSELDNAKWISTSPEMRTSRKHKNMDRKFVVQSVDIEGVFVHWQCKASCDEKEDKDAGIPKSYVSGDDMKRLKRLNLFESCMLQINDKNYLKITESDTIVRKSQWKKEQSNKYRILSNKQHQQSKKNFLSSDKSQEECGDNSKIRVTSVDCEHEHSETTKAECCDKNKLCPLGSGGKSMGKLLDSARKPSQFSNGGDSDDWQTEDDEMVDSDFSDSATTASSCSSNPTPKGSPKKSPLLAHKIQKLKKRRPKSDTTLPKVDDEVVTEALVVYSWATVVWQDGTIEKDIPSIELCPIHHLDDHEFFPADFVLAANEDNTNLSYRDYGVIQKVDHHGRTALVKWFSTYTDVDSPAPIYKGESEMSVYDLKDHPDFQYRPGTIVIRVANFTGDDANCTAGQVVDNYPEGRVKVWWVDGHVSMCWPQDLFEVGQYDSENNFWGNTSDDDSWETEDETSELGGMPQPHLTANLERARVAMARLEEMFIINPNLQSQEVMKKLLMVYKKCRYLDRLMNTSFFHESHFNGLVERVRKGGSQTTAERVQDQKNRLFKCDSIHNDEDEMKKPQKKANLLEITKSSSNSNEENSFCSFESTKSLCCSSGSNPGCSGSKNQLAVQQNNNLSTSSDISSIPDDPESRISLSPTNKVKTVKKSQDHDPDSGITITLSAERKESSFMISSQENFPNECVCAKLCSLIKVQLVKALQEINNRYCPSDTFKEIVELDEQKEDSEPPQEATVQNLALVHENSMDELAEKPINDPENFQVLEEAPNSHKYHLTVFHTTKAQEFFRAVQREHRLLRNSLPSGVWVRTFEDRLDLLSVMIEGPKNTPYEDGLFAFDLQLSHDYPRTPPLCHYISYCTDRLNPNLYEDGKVCVSLLGTWSGKGTEVWTSSSNLLQVIVSIQGLILVDEPYFNEAGYEKQRGTQQGKENSRMYNEMVVLKLVQSMTKMLMMPPEIFRDQVLNHFKHSGMNFYDRIKKWMDLSNEYNSSHNLNQLEISGYIDPANSKDIVHSQSLQCLMQYAPGFPLFPASRGFCLTLAGLLENFLSKLQTIMNNTDANE